MFREAQNPLPTHMQFIIITISFLGMTMKNALAEMLKVYATSAFYFSEPML
jgi:hypothetical protein